MLLRALSALMTTAIPVCSCSPLPQEPRRRTLRIATSTTCCWTESLRAAAITVEADRLRKFLRSVGVTIDDDNRRWQAEDGRRGRRPDAEDDRWEPGTAEPAARGDRIAAGLAQAAAAGDWTTTRCAWNVLREREIARRAANFEEADRIRVQLQELGFNVDDKRGTWSAADGRTGTRPNYWDEYWWGPWSELGSREQPTTRQDVGSGPTLWQRPPQPLRAPPPLTAAAGTQSSAAACPLGAAAPSAVEVATAPTATAAAPALADPFAGSPASAAVARRLKSRRGITF